MSQNSSNTIADQIRPHPKRQWYALLLYPAWIVASFILGIVSLSVIALILGIFQFPYTSINPALLSSVEAALLYVIVLTIALGGPRIIKRYTASRAELGLNRLPNWKDIWMTPIALVAYMIVSGIVIYLATTYVPAFNADQVQDTGFDQLGQRYEYILAFFTLVVVAPVAEEILLRGYLFGKLRGRFPLWIAIIVTSIIFAALHGAWNLALDTFVLSVFLCLLRVYTGSLWAPILLHMMKNGIAYYVLFINPLILTTIGG